jgi:mannonate dehydratase
MKLIFRWYGPSDPVPLHYIRQIPTISGIASAVYDVPVGEAWPTEKIETLKAAAKENGLAFEVVESVPVHEDIKLGRPARDSLIQNYGETLMRLGHAGVKVVCYNFMPVFDWFRSDVAKLLPDGSFTLSYDNNAVAALNPAISDVSLPGWDESYTKAELRALLSAYENVDENALWENLAYFLTKIIPFCERVGIALAIHPDDPPWSIFGLPRIITGAPSYKKLRAISSSKANGIAFCTGSLGASKENDLVEIAREYAESIYYVHARNIKLTGEKSFDEVAHPSACGDVKMYDIFHALYKGNFKGYIRSDHGRMIWGESGAPGYGLYDRALGAAYIRGLWEAIERGGAE